MLTGNVDAPKNSGNAELFREVFVTASGHRFDILLFFSCEKGDRRQPRAQRAQRRESFLGSEATICVVGLFTNANALWEGRVTLLYRSRPKRFLLGVMRFSVRARFSSEKHTWAKPENGPPNITPFDREAKPLLGFRRERSERFDRGSKCRAGLKLECD